MDLNADEICYSCGDRQVFGYKFVFDVSCLTVSGIVCLVAWSWFLSLAIALYKGKSKFKENTLDFFPSLLRTEQCEISVEIWIVVSLFFYYSKCTFFCS